MAASAFANQLSFRRAQSEAYEGGTFEKFGAVAVSSLAADVSVTVPEQSKADDLERAIDYGLTLGRERGGSLGCWAHDCPAPRWVMAASVSRGLQWGWTARWMVCRAPFLQRTAPLASIRIEKLESVPPKRVSVPYVDEKWAALLLLDKTTVVLGAFDGDMFIGTVSLHVNPVEPSAAVFNLGVAESYRRRGIGSALMQHALEEAARQGLQEVTLNATEAGAPLYQAMGFEDVGRGQTWWVVPEMWARPPPTSEQRKVAQAIAMNQSDIPRTSNEMLPCNLTPMRLAATTRSPEAAEALQEQGIRLDALSAWDLGWRHRARDAAMDSIDHFDEVEGATLLHTAIQRDDKELARMCLDLGARTDIKDTTFNSDALGWCAALDRPEIREMIEHRNSSPDTREYLNPC